MATAVLAAASVRLGPTDIVYVTQGLDIVWASATTSAILGFAPEELVGRPAMDLVSPHQDRTWIDANRHRLLSGRTVMQRLLVRRKDGADRWFSGIAHPIHEGVGDDGFVVVLRPMDSPDEANPWATEPQHAPTVDEATGVSSRRAVLEVIDRSLRESASTLRPMTVLIAEFGNLGLVNESLGQASGDLALGVFASRLSRAAHVGETVGRISGKSFMMVCPGQTDAQLQARAASLVQQLSAEMQIGDRRVQPSVHAAIVPTRSGATALTMLRDADVALSHARRNDDARVAIFEPEMSESAVRRFVLEDELRFGIDADEFTLYFQPIVSLDSGEMIAAEALVRWNHPREGMLTPAGFMEIAEESKVIRPIGRRVLAKVCRVLADLPEHSMQMGVNVSGVELNDDKWLEGFLEIVDRSGINPCCLVLEVTETAMLRAHRDIGSDLRALRARGVGIFLDDFGTGYSSLALLRDFPVTGVKLDKSFVASLDDEDSFGAALAQGIVDLIRPLGLSGVAEGIETPERAEQLRQLGWQFGQGYAFGHPAPLSALPPMPSRAFPAH